MVQWQPPIEGRKVEGGAGGGSLSGLRRERGPAGTLLRAMMSEQRNHLHSACRLVSLVDNAARGVVRATR